MILILVNIYRAWPLRPHCGKGRHSLPCLLLNGRAYGCGDSTRPPMP